MKNSILAGMCLFVAIAQTAGAASDEVVELRQEVRKLHLELLQQKVEFQQWKMRNLSVALQQVQAERQQLDEQMRATQREIAELEISMSPELEGLKDKLSKERLPMLESWLRSVRERESALSGELQAEGMRHAEMQLRIQKVTASK